MTIALSADDIRSATHAGFSRKRLFSLGVPLLVLAYLVYVFVSFDLAGIVQRARPDNAKILVSDTYSFKTT